MPSFKTCRLEFLQAIFAGKKKALRATDVPARRVPHWPEMAVKTIYPQMIAMHPDLLDYLLEPHGNKVKLFPEREFFYTVLNALHPDTYEDLIA